MSVELVDTNLLVYAHESSAGAQYFRSVQLPGQGSAGDPGGWII